MKMSVSQSLEKAKRHAKKGDTGQANILYQQILEKFPNNVRARDGLVALAIPATKKNQTEPSQQQIYALISLLNQGRSADAIRQSSALIKQFPKAAMPYNIQGTAYASLERLDAAQSSFVTAIRLQPNFGEAHSNLGNVLQDKGDIEGAIKSFRRALQLSPDFAEAHSNLGNALNISGETDAAIECFVTAIKLKPRYAEAHINLGVAQAAQDDLKAAVKSIARAIAINPDNAKAHMEFGIFQQKAGQIDSAITSFERALELDPEFAKALVNYGRALNERGDSVLALEKFNQALKIDPNLVVCYLNFSRQITFSESDPYVHKMRAIMASNDLSDKDLMYLNFALGKAECDVGNKELGVKYFIKANALQKEASGYKIGTDKKLFASVKEFFSNETQDPKPKSDIQQSPVFILGMPRSGTSLVEQILTSHTGIFGGGELGFLTKAVEKSGWQTTSDRDEVFRTVRADYLKDLSELSDTRIITDKLPHNFRWIGFILTALPEAKIIHMNRQPEAICWSNFITHFGASGMGFTCGLQDIATYYRMYQDLMDFWNSRFPNRIYNLDYQRLTKNQEAETRRLFEYLEIEWQDGVLDFHKNRRSVKTASNTQVRKKMYQGSSQEWQAYEPWLEPMLEILRA